jgi:hypothetical protein
MARSFPRVGDPHPRLQKPNRAAGEKKEKKQGARLREISGERETERLDRRHRGAGRGEKRTGKEGDRGPGTAPSLLPSTPAPHSAAWPGGSLRGGFRSGHFWVASPAERGQEEGPHRGQAALGHSAPAPYGHPTHRAGEPAGPHQGLFLGRPFPSSPTALSLGN